MSLRKLLLAAVLASPVLARANPDLGLGNEESLTYHVSWAVLPGVGSITVNAGDVLGPAGKPMLRVVTRTATRGLAHLILPFEANAESLFDKESERLLWLSETSTTRTKYQSHTVAFDYPNSRAVYTEASSPPRNLPMPPGYPTDLITCLLHARTWDLKPGQARDALVLFEDEFYQLTVHATGYESVDTPLGTFNTLVLEPRMEKTPPKGMFKRGSTVRVWVAQDARRLPVRFHVQFKFGSGVATLSAYRPPVEAK